MFIGVHRDIQRERNWAAPDAWIPDGRSRRGSVGEAKHLAQRAYVKPVLGAETSSRPRPCLGSRENTQTFLAPQAKILARVVQAGPTQPACNTARPPTDT